MASPTPRLALLDWRRRVAGLYAHVRTASGPQRAEACEAFRHQRDGLFKHHVQSPLTPAQRDRFLKLAYDPYRPEWRVVGELEPPESEDAFTVTLPEGPLRYIRTGHVRFNTPAGAGRLSVFWLEGYGGGLFLPFRDASNGRTSYGGGRYLFDTIKGADLGTNDEELVLDFNYAYNPSCAYTEQWVCPLSPPENTLSFAVEAGERTFPADDAG